MMQQTPMPIYLTARAQSTLEIVPMIPDWMVIIADILIVLTLVIGWAIFRETEQSR